VADFSESSTSPRRTARAQKQARALELRIAGWRFDDIAEELGYSHRSGPSRLVKDALDLLAARTSESATEMRTLETERLTGVIRVANEIMADPEASIANKIRAAELVVRASESLRKLWGLDAPAALDLTSGGAALPSVPELIAALRAAESIEPDVDTDNG